VHDILTAGGGEGTGIRLETSEGAVVVNNTVTRAQGMAMVFGHGTGGPTSNLTLMNNIFEGAVTMSVGTQWPGYKAANNLFPAGARFMLGGVAGDFAAYQAQTGDRTSTQGDLALDQTTFTPSATAAIDRGSDVGLPFCGSAPDIGAVETGC
jgi:hypothetical protein